MNKLNNISILRLLACIGVFLFHYLAGFTNFNTSVYMPSYFFVFIFAFISAFLYSQKEIENTKSWLKKNLTKLLVPLIIYVLIASVIEIVVGLIRYQGDFIQTFHGFVGENYINGKPNFLFGNLWFLIILTLCYLVTPLLYKITRNLFKNKSNKIIVLILIILVMVMECCFNFFAPVFSVYVISYFAGRLIYKKTLEDKCPFVPIISFILLAGALAAWYLLVGKIEYVYLDIHIRLLRDVNIFFVSIPLSIFLLYTLRPLNRFKLSFLKYTDKYSFPFYMCQQLFMVGTLMFYELIPNWYFVPVIGLTIVLAIIVQFISDLILKKINFVKG